MSQEVRSRAPEGDDAFFYVHPEDMAGTSPPALKPQLTMNPLPTGEQEGKGLELGPTPTQTPPGFKAPNNTVRDMNYKKIENTTGMQSNEVINKQMVTQNLAAMQRTQNSLTNLNPQNLLDTNMKIYSLRGDVNLFDPSTSKNQTKGQVYP